MTNLDPTDEAAIGKMDWHHKVHPFEASPDWTLGTPWYCNKCGMEENYSMHILAKSTPRTEGAIRVPTTNLDQADEAAMGTVTAEAELTVPDLLKADKELAARVTMTNELAPDENGWMPIETLGDPVEHMDEIIGGWWSAGVWLVRNAFWDDGRNWEEHGFFSRTDATGWWSYDNSVGAGEIFPTHFLPLPNPPKE